MRLIKPSYKILNQPAGLQGIYEQIELAGRTCYASSHKIQYQENDTHDGQFSTTAKEFVDRMIKSGHGAMLEHGTVYLKFDYIIHSFGKGYLGGLKYRDNPYSKVVLSKEDTTQYVTTNLRVLVENNWLDDLKYICEPTEYHDKRICVRFICDRGVSHEYVRHRVFSFAQESTRYCNYSKDKFNNELTFIQPVWTYHQEDGDYGTLGTPKRKNGGNSDGTFYEFIKSLQYAELYYFRLLQEGWKPQQARAVLPNALKTELVMTGLISDWEHFFDLRCDSAAHPQARELAIPLKEEFIKRGYI